MQGLFGIFPFTVTEAEVCTFRDFKTSRELSYAEHKCLSGLSKLQHTGRNLDTVSLNVQIVPLGVISTVEARLRLLQGLSLLGTELPLVIGLKYKDDSSKRKRLDLLQPFQYVPLSERARDVACAFRPFRDYPDSCQY